MGRKTSGNYKRNRRIAFERDGWVCQWCGVACNNGEAAPDNPTAATADHIIPHSKGGWDSVDNLETLCWGCNQAKGNEGTDGSVRLGAVVDEGTRRALFEMVGHPKAARWSA